MRLWGSTRRGLSSSSSSSWYSVRVSSASSPPTFTPWRALSSSSSSNETASGAPSPFAGRASARMGALSSLTSHGLIELFSLAHVERLAQVVVGAGVEPVDAVGDGVAGGEHQDRLAVAARAHAAAD